MMTFELIPVGPLWPLGLMLAERSSWPPTQSEPPFIAARSILLIIRASIGFLAFRRFSSANPKANQVLAVESTE